LLKIVNDENMYSDPFEIENMFKALLLDLEITLERCLKGDPRDGVVLEQNVPAIFTGNVALQIV